MAIEPIKDIIPSVIENISGQKTSQYQKLQKTWTDTLSKKDAAHTALEGIKDDCLVVSVDSPARLFSLNIQKKKILKQLQKKIPDLKNISFKVGKTQ